MLLPWLYFMKIYDKITSTFLQTKGGFLYAHNQNTQAFYFSYNGIIAFCHDF